MRLFLDTASIEEIREINRWGVLKGVTTNPSLIAKEHGDPDAIWQEILTTVDGDISLEVTDLSSAQVMEAEGRKLAEKADNVVVKLPMTPDGLSAGRRLIKDGIRINVTLVFSPAQAILAAEIGAYIVSPFLGRLDDAGSDGMAMLRQITEIFAVQAYETQVLAASLRHPMHIIECAEAGADIATMPYDVFEKLVRHPLTDIGLKKFEADWNTLQTELKGRA